MFASTPRPQPLALTYREAAELLRLSATMVRLLVRRGEIPAVRIGRSVRILRESLLRFAAEHEGRAPAGRVRRGEVGDVHRAATGRIADAPDVAPGAPRAGAPTTPATPRGVATDPGPAA